MRTRSCVSILAAALALALPGLAAAQWTILGQSGSWTSKGAAKAHMHSISSTYAKLTIEKLYSADESYTTYEYSAPLLPPVPTSDWGYRAGVQTFPTEAALIADMQAGIDAQPNGGCSNGTLVPDGAWFNETNQWGVATRDRRNYRITGIENYAAGPPPSCFPVPDDTNYILRDRTVNCPTDYTNYGHAPGCYVSTVGRISGPPQLECGDCPNAKPPKVASAIDVSYGTKVQREPDWAGAGIEFVRSYSSLHGERWPRLGVGWTHNFRKKLILTFGTPAGMARGNGYDLAFRSISSSHYIATSGGGEQLKSVSGQWKLYLSDGTIETYDTSGRLLTINERGHLTTLTYTGEDLTSIAGPFGHTLQLQYQDGLLKRLIDPAGGEIEYTYTGENLTQVEYADSTTRTYHYEDASFTNHLTGITDESGTRFSTYGYDAAGKATSSEHAGGVEHYTVSYGSNTATVTTPLTASAVYTFNNANNRRVLGYSIGGHSRSALAPAQSWDYFQRRMTQLTDERGFVTTFGYDLNHLTSKTEASGTSKARTTTYAYNATTDDLPTLITEGNRTTAFTYNGSGAMLTQTVTDTATSESRTWTWTRNSHGRVLTADGPRTDVSDVTTYTYYGAAATCTATVTGASTTGCRGQLETITNALSHVTTFNEYNAHGQALKITDPNGTVTTLAYDARQRLTSRSVGGETTTFEYWPTGLLKKVTLPDASFLAYTYDAAHRLTEVEDDEGNRIEYGLDDAGNRTAEEVYDPLSALVRTHTRVFNTLNQLWKDVNAEGTAAVTTVFGYDANGNQNSIAAPLSRNTSQLYDELDRLKQITDPGSGVTQFAYNRFDELTQVTDPRSLVTTYTYNNLGDLTQLQSPDTGTTTNTYDSAGNLETRTDARSKTGTYAYDELNRVTSITFPDQALTYTYDAGTNGKGHLTGASDANHSLAWTYDALGRVTAKDQTVGAVTKSITYGFTNGNLTSLGTPSGQTITYGYSDGKVSSITLNGTTTILTQVLHDPFGPISGWTWGNSTLAVRTYDQDGKIEAVDSAGASTYGYDDAFRITGITDLDDSSRSWTYGYDTLDRLTSGAKTGQTIGYTYDANGNRLTQTGTQAATYTVSGTSNRVSSITGTPARSYSYDAAGNTTGYGGLTFAYADSGRMKSVTDPSDTTNYTINALGQRVKKAGPGGTWLFVYDEAGHLLGEYDGTGALVQETVWMGDIPVATLRPNGGGVSLFYVHSDHLNSPRRISRHWDNVIVWRWDSDPFGSTGANEDPDGDSTSFAYNLRFLGQYHDAESGLSYNYFRDYDPRIGKYIESDPIGLEGGINTYAYVLDPNRFVDRFGLAAKVGSDTTSQRIMALIREGRMQDLKNLLEAGGLNPAQEALAKRGLTRAADLIRGALKRSKSYHSELENKTYAEICKIAAGKGEEAKRAQQMKKLIEQADRLQGKRK